jgi:hypothetical protein
MRKIKTQAYTAEAALSDLNKVVSMLRKMTEDDNASVHGIFTASEHNLVWQAANLLSEAEISIVKGI